LVLEKRDIYTITFDKIIMLSRKYLQYLLLKKLPLKDSEKRNKHKLNGNIPKKKILEEIDMI